MPRVDYSELVDALRSGDEERAKILIEELIPRLEEYLRVVMGADESSARECVQQSFYEVIDQIQRGKIRKEKSIFSYLLTACRNEFMTYSKYQHRFVGEEKYNPPLEPADQLENLIDDERQRILKECLEELEPKSRKLITYLLENPDEPYKKVAQVFKIKEGTIRTRRSRIIAILHQCYQWKSTQ